jgi:hypothetical protein
MKSVFTRSLVSSALLIALNACNSHGVKNAASGANQSVGDGTQRERILEERTGAFANTDLSLSMGKGGLLEIVHLSGPSAAALYRDLGIQAKDADPITVGTVVYKVKAKVGAGAECRELSPEDPTSKQAAFNDCRIGYTPKRGVVGRITPPYAGDKVIVDPKDVAKDPSFKGSSVGALTSNLLIKKGEKKALIIINNASALFDKMTDVAAAPLKTPAKQEGKSEQKLAPHVIINQDSMKDSLEPVTKAGIQINLEDGTAILNEGGKVDPSPIEDSESDASSASALAPGIPSKPSVHIVFTSLIPSDDQKSLELSYDLGTPASAMPLDNGAQNQASVSFDLDLEGVNPAGAQACMSDVIEAKIEKSSGTIIIPLVSDAEDANAPLAARPTSIKVTNTKISIGNTGVLSSDSVDCSFSSKIQGISIDWPECKPATAATL